MQEPYSEGLADHTGPESCGCVGNSTPEALTGVHAGRVLSRVSTYFIARSADAVEIVGRPRCICRFREAYTGSVRSETPCTYGSSLHRNWEIPCLTSSEDGGGVRTVNPYGVMQ